MRLSPFGIILILAVVYASHAAADDIKPLPQHELKLDNRVGDQHRPLNILGNEPDAGLNPKDRFTYDALKILTRPGNKPDFHLGDVSGGDFYRGLMQGNSRDELILASASVLAVVKALNDFNDWRSITVAGPEGGTIVGNFLKDRIPGGVLKKRAGENPGCKNGLDEGKVANCFVGIDPLKAIVSPETLSEKTYLKALSNLSSLVDKSNQHICDVSVYKKNLWVTAKHCVDASTNSSLSLISDNEVLVVKKTDIRLCEGACDIAFITLKTPKSAIPPVIVDPGTKIDWSVSVLVPGLPEHTNLNDILTGNDPYDVPDAALVRSRYNKKVIWSAYGQGFCMVVKQSPNGCLVHTCNSVGGFSGAPVYTFDEQHDQLVLLGIHSGSEAKYNGCDPEQDRVNYARLITADGVNP